MKPRLAFVDHSFHRKTQSGDFLRALFSTHFEVVDFWDESWQRGGRPVSVDEINAGDFSYVFFFQMILDISALRRLRPGIVWAPMYDGVRDWEREIWPVLATVPMKIVCFSKALQAMLEAYGLNCRYIQYFMDPALFPPVTDYGSNRIFFWQRGRLTFADVKKIIGGNPVGQCLVKLDPDPGFLSARLTPDDMEKYKVARVINGGMERNEYLGLLQQSNIFIAPRKYEGIGMSFLEAMAMGMVVIGMNQPTLNEYIRHNENGLLLDEGNLSVEFGDIARLGRRARQDCENGFLGWQEQKQTILRYILLEKEQ